MADNLIFPIGFDLEKAVNEAGQQWDKKYSKKLEDYINKRPIKVKLDFEKLEDVKKRLAQLKIEPITPDTRASIKELARELQVLAKALEQVQKYSISRSSASPDAVRASKIRVNEERAQAQAALAAQRAARAEANLAQARLRDARAANIGATATRDANKAYLEQAGYLQRLAQRMAAYWSIRQVGQFLTNVREVTAQFELQRVSLGAIIQDQNRANQLFSEIKSFALQSPVSILDLTKYTKQLAAYKFETEGLFDWTKRLTDISVGLSVPMERIVLLAGQVRATGWLRQSEVRQATEAGIPLVEELAAKLTKMNGEMVTAAEVMDMISKRAISWEMVADIFKDMTSAGGTFYNMQEKQGNTLFGLWAKLGDAASVMYDEIGNTESVNKGMKNAIQLLTDFMRNWKALANTAAWVVAPTALTAMFAKYALSSARKQAADAAAIAATKAREAAVLQLSQAIEKGSIEDINAANATLQKAKADEIAAKRATTNTGLLASGFKSIASSMAMGLGIGLAVTAVTTLAYKLFEAWENAHRLKNKLDEIDAERIVVSEQSVRNFEYLADAALDTSKSVKEQKEKLEELHRTFQNMIPVEDMSVENLRRLRNGADNASDAYRSLTDSIREYIAQQQKQKALGAIEEEFGAKRITAMRNLYDWFDKQGLGVEERTRFFAEFEKQAQDTSKSLKEQIVSAFEKAGIEGGEKLADSITQEKSFWSKASDWLAKNRPMEFGTTAALLNWAEYGSVLPDKSYINDLANATQRYNEEVSGTLSYYEKLEGNIGKYTKALEDAKKHMADFIPQGFKSDTFAYQQEVNAEQIRTWGGVIVDALKAENVKIENEWFNIDKNKAFDIADVASINIKAIKDALGSGHSDIKKLLDRIATSYNEIVPKDAVVRSVRNKFEELANSMGLIDKVKGNLMGATEGLEDYRKKINDTAKDYAKQVENLTKVLAATPVISLAYKEIAEKLQNAKDLKEFYSKMAEILGKSTSGHTTDQRLQNLKEEISLYEKLYQEYKQYEKAVGSSKAAEYMSREAKETIEALAKKYGIGLPKNATDLTSALEILYKKMQALPSKVFKNLDKELKEFRWKIEKVDIDESQKKIESELKRLADRISRTKTAKEFYEKIFSQTGNADLAGRLATSIFGEQGDALNREIADRMRKLVENTSATLPDIVFNADMSVNSKALRSWARENEKLLGEGGEAYKGLISIANEADKDTAKLVEGWLKATEKAKTYGDKLTDVYRRTAAEIKRIESEIAKGAISQSDGMKIIADYRRKEAEEIAKLQHEAFKDSPLYVEMFDDLDNASTRMLKNMKARLLEMQGAWRNLDPSQLKEMQSRLREIDSQLTKRNPFKALADGMRKYYKLRTKGDSRGNKSRKDADSDVQRWTESYLKAEEELAKLKNDPAATEAQLAGAAQMVTWTKRQKEEAEKAAINWKKVEDAIGLSANELFQMLNWSGDIARGIADISEVMGADEEDVQYWNDMADALDQISGGIQDIVSAAMSGNVVGIISSTLTAIPKMFVGFANIFSAGKVRRANKEIKRQQELLEQLEYTYSRLEKAADKVFGSDYINNYNQQLKVLQAQATAYQRQAEAERSKGKKKDKAKIKEYENAYRDTMDQIADMQGQIAAQMYGTDLTSAARDFANAWLDAYKEFGNTADAMSGKFHEMIESMVVESLLAKVMESALAPAFKLIDEMEAGDFYSTEFWEKVAATAEQGAKDADHGASVMMKFLEGAGISVRDLGGDLTGISRDIASASEESINGLAAGIKTQNYYISQQLTEVRMIRQLLEGGASATLPTASAAGWTDWQHQAMENYNAIARNTAETVVECRAIAARCEEQVALLRRVIVPKGTTGSHGVQIWM